METITSTTGAVETVTVRHTVSADAEQISTLITPETAGVFGRVNVIHLLEKANLAVTLASASNEVIAHATFLDHPIGDLVDQDSWEKYLRINFTGIASTPLNTLFLHLFVAKSNFAIASPKEIIRTVFNAITELEYICLLTPYDSSLDLPLAGIFEPLPCIQKGVFCSAFVCYRHNHCPRLYMIRARVEDHDDLMPILEEQNKALVDSYGPYFMVDLIEAQDETNHVLVCKSGDDTVGFIIIAGDVNLELLNQSFELGLFDGLRKKNAEIQTNPVPEIQDAESGEDSPPEEPSNAFCIQLFLINKRFEMRSTDILPYVFKLFPERDFCIISVPRTELEFPLLKTFIRVLPSYTNTLPDELYIFHRAGLLKSLVVRVAVSLDRLEVENLVQNHSGHKALLEDLNMFLKAHRDADGTPVQAFVAEVEAQIVGIIIMKNEQDIEYIKANYKIEKFVYFSHHQREEHGQICHFALNPIFQHYAKHFLKETLRLAHKSCLYYPIYPPYHSQKNSHSQSITSVLNCMVPVHPRRQITYPLNELHANAPSKLITKDQVPYALNHINRKLTMESKIAINARIVVVGASDVGLAFLETLVFSSRLRFNNLTLISTYGLPDHKSNKSMKFLTVSHGYNDREHGQLSLRSWVNVVTGKMTAIDRNVKHVQVYDGHKLPYDHLILCTGQQYQMPCPTGIDITKWTSASQKPERPTCQYTGPIPSNFFTLNHQQDCTQAYRWLQKNFVDQAGSAVVYGDTKDVYSCVETLLCLGVQGCRIHLVHQYEDKQQSCFQNPEVEQAVRSALNSMGVHVHYSCLLAQLNDGQNLEPLTTVSFTTDDLPLRLECVVFFNFSLKRVDYEAFKAINDACLVFDGCLVIDASFHTNDSAIYAAGPLTKFANRYHAGQWSHARFNSKEVGQALAAALLPLFDPLLELPPSPQPSMDLIPNYSQPKIQGGSLPGGYKYLHIAKPSIHNNRVSTASDLGRDILTKQLGPGKYFHLHFNQHGIVESITCLSLRPLPVSNYICLYGKHQLLLNRIYERYDENLIDDLFSYFRESWCLALFHDRFADFEQEIWQIMESSKVKLDDQSVSIPNLAEMIVDGTRTMPLDPNLYLSMVFEQKGHQATLKKSVVQYLKFNRYHLPMYALPGLL